MTNCGLVHLASRVDIIFHIEHHPGCEGRLRNGAGSGEAASEPAPEPEPRIGNRNLGRRESESDAGNSRGSNKETGSRKRNDC